jgi:predicted SAM-dependent methyltransferase
MNLKKIARKLIPEIIIDEVRKMNYNRITKPKIRTILNNNQFIKLEIGAGNKKGINEWITLDINKKCDLFWDLRLGIPFPDNSIHIIYSSHLFEHLSFNETRILLKECKRVLIPNGVFSICVPNARFYLEAYVNRDKNFWSSKPAYWEAAYNNTTMIDYVNYVAYMDWEHKYMFDEENLIHILNLNGFNNANLRKFDESIDLLERDHESIYAIAYK